MHVTRSNFFWTLRSSILPLIIFTLFFIAIFALLRSGSTPYTAFLSFIRCLRPVPGPQPTSKILLNFIFFEINLNNFMYLSSLFISILLFI